MKPTNIQVYSAIAGAALLAIIAQKLCCGASIPKGVKAVKPFDLKKYMGKWYEIARLDFSHEKNLMNVTARYTLKKSGMVQVHNQGYDTKKDEWVQTKGKATLVDDPNEGRLQVSFFGPFYSGYNVVALDKNYQYALVMGNNLKYLWILAREKFIPNDIKQSYLEMAKKAGYDVKKLVWTRHD